MRLTFKFGRPFELWPGPFVTTQWRTRGGGATNEGPNEGRRSVHDRSPVTLVVTRRTMSPPALSHCGATQRDASLSMPSVPADE